VQLNFEPSTSIRTSRARRANAIPFAHSRVCLVDLDALWHVRCHHCLSFWLIKIAQIEQNIRERARVSFTCEFERNIMIKQLFGHLSRIIQLTNPWSILAIGNTKSICERRTPTTMHGATTMRRTRPLSRFFFVIWLLFISSHVFHHKRYFENCFRKITKMQRQTFKSTTFMRLTSSK
jgi:hypothetical protein